MKDLLYNFGVKQNKVLCFIVCIVFKSQNFLFFPYFDFYMIYDIENIIFCCKYRTNECI